MAVKYQLRGDFKQKTSTALATLRQKTSFGCGNLSGFLSWADRKRTEEFPRNVGNVCIKSTGISTQPTKNFFVRTDAPPPFSSHSFNKISHSETHPVLVTS